MAKKSFKTGDNPVMQFISQPREEKPTNDLTPARAEKAPAGYKVNPDYIETKSRRVQLLIQPSIHEAVKAKARAQGISVNEAINEALREYTER